MITHLLDSICRYKSKRCSLGAMIFTRYYDRLGGAFGVRFSQPSNKIWHLLICSILLCSPLIPIQLPAQVTIPPEVYESIVENFETQLHDASIKDPLFLPASIAVCQEFNDQVESGRTAQSRTLHLDKAAQMQAVLMFLAALLTAPKDKQDYEKEYQMNYLEIGAVIVRKCAINVITNVRKNLRREADLPNQAIRFFGKNIVEKSQETVRNWRRTIPDTDRAFERAVEKHYEQLRKEARDFFRMPNQKPVKRAINCNPWNCRNSNICNKRHYELSCGRSRYKTEHHPSWCSDAR